MITTTYAWCLILLSHPFRNLYFWLLTNGGEENGTHFSLCASDQTNVCQTNVGWVTLSSIQVMSSRLTTCSFLEYANYQQSWPTNSSNHMLCISDKVAFFPLCCQSTSSRRFRMDGQIGNSPIMTIDHLYQYCWPWGIELLHGQAWCPLVFKLEETINPN